MAKTGYLVSVYMDANPYSPTYGQERTERELDTTECQTQQPANYVIVNTYCEMNPNGSYTGNCVKVYEDVEPLSPTYGQQMEEVVTDQVLCPPDSAESNWQQEGESYCEQIAYQPSGKLGNSGYMVTLYRDVNEYSPTYNQTREVKEQDLVNCTPPSTEPVWVVVSETCHLVNGLKDGTKDVVRIDTNQYSPYYNDGLPETANIADTAMCPPDSDSPEWTETSYVCVLDEGYRTGYVTVTEEDTNPHSATYGQTRTRTYEDSERCPYQPKPQPVTLKWRVVNNRSGSTDTITSFTATCNDGLVLSMTGSIPPAGGTSPFTMPLAGTKVDVPFVVSSIDISPNTQLPTKYQWSQTPNPFVWSSSSGSDVLTITLTDGDGTSPIWTEVSYVCNTVSGFRDGSSTITEEDTNPDSASYGTQRTRTISNDSRCPAQTEANWVEDSWSCQQTNGYNTGAVISIQTDTNPLSATYNTTRTRIIEDTVRCPISTAAGWEEISYYCQQTDGFDNGNTVITQEDKNPNSSTYGQTRQFVSTNDPRCVQDTNPSWSEVSYVCEQSDATADWVEVSRSCQKDGNNENTGYVIIIETDMNPYSSTVGQTRTRTVQDLTNCPVNTTPNWVEQSRTCQKDGNNENTGYATVVELDTNPYSSTYNTTRTTIVQDLVNCPLPVGNFKVKYTYQYNHEVTVPCDGTTTIDYDDFTNHDIIDSIVFGDCATTIARWCFDSVTLPTSIHIPANITTFGDANPFSSFSYLESVTVDSNNTVFDSRNNCNAIIETATNKLVTGCKNTVIPNTVVTIGASSFSNCRDMLSVSIPNSVTEIQGSAFESCYSLRTVNMGSNVTSIGAAAFSGCKDLTSITIPNSVTTLGNYPFSGCTSLASITIGSGVTSIPYLCFEGCSALTTITIPNNVTTIGQDVFESCTGLTTITVGTGVTQIGYHAFSGCTSLTSITLLATTPPTIFRSFDDTNNCPIYVPASSLSAYQSATGEWTHYTSRLQAIPNS